MQQKDQLIKNFNKAVLTYDGASHFQAQIAFETASRVEKDSPSQILEVGCGTGILSEHLLKFFPTANFCLIDISPNMISFCQKKFGQYSNVKTFCMDADHLELSQKFDLIISSMTFHWLDHFSETIENLKKYLLPNGKLIFSMLGNNSFQEWKKSCFDFNLIASTPIFPHTHHLDSLLPDFYYEVILQKKTYENAYCFLKNLKSLGTHTSNPKINPLSTKQLRSVLRSLNHTFNLTYEVIYAEYQAK